MPMAKYQAQYRALSAQFGAERSIFYNDAHLAGAYAGTSQQQQHGIVTDPESGGLIMNIKSENGSWESDKNDDDTRVLESSTSQIHAQANINEETGQPPVLGASTTEEVLRPAEANEGSRPALKLKIHLNSISMLNRKNRLLAERFGAEELRRSEERRISLEMYVYETLLNVLYPVVAD
ncbi:unnamed protein product [Gongylonema pulchrum]|uniref:Uncharacterized protein n=1 Tax=Gongylonema pulchrum TaxID=637853 RepID=A0A183EBR4_9BILA|nr:unnamed protein product [Gongylonema pulchrum]